MYNTDRAHRPDYHLCSYGASRLSFRGPPSGTDAPFCVTLGGSETFGTGVDEPFPASLARLLGRPVINLGCPNAGLDALVADDTVMAICARAHLTVVQVLGAQYLSNSYYSVHPRRNDRFLRARAPLQNLFPEVEFARFHFTGHMLQELHAVSPTRFAVLLADLQQHWVARMQQLAARLSRRSVLLWLTPQPPATTGPAPAAPFVDCGTLAQVRGEFTAFVQADLPVQDCGAADTAQGPGTAAHDALARQLAPVVDRLIAC
ncbi:DUF6473 family protein [Actibacterium ureilyticum]|uniref:DUF6473 family protein n=1 Tax=Actibacterium ureilyticum TaxID=1590614 RepID=UPI000BAAC53D|nr:DUF6473 family protein [Actibacterium ureilyticum]